MQNSIAITQKSQQARLGAHSLSRSAVAALIFLVQTNFPHDNSPLSTRCLGFERSLRHTNVCECAYRAQRRTWGVSSTFTTSCGRAQRSP